MPYSRSLPLTTSHIVAILVFPLLGCSIHPLPPGDIPRVATINIVERIRCEAQEGLREGLSDPDLNAPLVAQILKGTKIGFDFVFDIAEDNGLGAVAESPVPPGSLTPGGFKPGNLTLQRKGTGDNLFTLGLTGGAATQRHNVRRFRIIEDLSVVKNANCQC
jgi:hypothetical protein